MSFSALNGRLRLIPPAHDDDDNHRVSTCPVTLPNGIITIHNVGVAGSQASRCPFQLYNLHEVHSCSKRHDGSIIIVDHCWTTLAVDHDLEIETNDNKVLVLAVLTRRGGSDRVNVRGEKTTMESEPERAPASSILMYYCRSKSDGLIKKGTRNEKSHKERTLARAIHLNSFASSIAIDRNVLVVATCTGALIYPSLLLSSCNPTEISKSFPVHAMSLSCPYLVVASGDRVGIWRVDDAAANNNQVAVWTTKIDHFQSRITCIALLSSPLVIKHEDDECDIIAMSCWDGSAYVFRRCSGSTDSAPYLADKNNADQKKIDAWDRVTTPYLERSPIWERAAQQQVNRNLSAVLFPTFVAIHSSLGVEGTTDTLIAVSTPGSSIVRYFDITYGVEVYLNDSMREFDNGVVAIGNHQHKSNAIHGMLSVAIHKKSNMNEFQQLVWIDSNDVIYQYSWPKQNGLQAFVSMIKEGTNGEHLVKLFLHKDNVAESRDHHQAWLAYDRTKQKWIIMCHWVSMEDDKDEEIATLSLSFLEDSIVLDFIKRSPSFGFAQHCNETDTSPFAIICNRYLGIYVPSYDMLYVYGRYEKGWKAFDIKDETDLVEALGLLKVTFIVNA